MWIPNDNKDSYYSNTNTNRNSRRDCNSVRKNQLSSSRKNRPKPFWEYYIDDYMADCDGRLNPIQVRLSFGISFEVFNIHIHESLHLYNLKQFLTTLRYYNNSSNRFHSLRLGDRKSYLSNYEDLYQEVDKRNTIQIDTDDKMHQLSKYLTLNLKEYSKYSFYLKYIDLNRSTLSLAMKHLEYIILTFKTWSYLSSSVNEMDRLMIEVLRGCNEGILRRSFPNYHIDSLWKDQSLPLTGSDVKFTLEIQRLNGYCSDSFSDEFGYACNLESRYELTKILKIKHTDQLVTILKHYGSHRRIFYKFVPLQIPSRYRYLHDDITYRNDLQLRIVKVIKRIYEFDQFSFSISRDKHDPLILDFTSSCSNDNYDCKSWQRSQIPIIIRYLELMILTFKTWNDDAEDGNTMDRFFAEVMDRFLPSNYHSFESFYEYYLTNPWREKPVIPNDIQLELSIISREYRYDLIRTFHLERLEPFRDLLRSLDLLPNGYLISPNSQYKPTAIRRDLLYIFDENKDNPSVMNLYYYPLSDKLDISLIVDHIAFVLEKFRSLSDNLTDKITLHRHLTSITHDLTSIDIKASHLSISTPSHLSISPTHRLPSTTSHLSISIPNINPYLTTVLSAPNDDIPWYNLDTQLEAMIVWNNLYNSSLDSPEEVSEQSSDRIRDPKVYWKAWWTGILQGDRMEKRRIEIRDNEEDEEDDDDNKDGILPKDPLEDTSLTGRLGPKDVSMMGISGSRDISALDGRLGGVSASFPNLLEVEEEDISMMEDVD